MRKILWLARREFLATVKTKGFIIGLIAMPLLACGSVIIMALTHDKVDIADKHLAIIDRSGVVAERIIDVVDERNTNDIFTETGGEQIKPAYILEIVKPNNDSPEEQRLTLSNRVRNGELYAFLDIGADVLHPEKGDSITNRITYHAKRAAIDDIPGWIDWPINTQLRRMRMLEAGMDSAAAEEAITWLNVESMGLVEADSETGEIQQASKSNKIQMIVPPLATAMLLLIMIMMGAAPLLHTVMEEKTQRIAEVLLGSIRPFEFMAGKIIGGVGVSLTASIVYVFGGLLFLSNMGMGEYIPYHILPWFFIYMLLANIMFGSINASLGAICNDPKDAQNLTFPSMLPVMIPMFMLMPVIKEPLSVFATWMSLIPPFTPLLMTLRLSTPTDIPAWQPWVGLVGVIAFSTLAVWAGGRIFRVGILMQGKPPRLADLVRWAIRG
jgi:ABC-2 type transport system permease protein